MPSCVKGRSVAIIHVAGFAANILSPYILFLVYFINFDCTLRNLNFISLQANFFKPLPSLILGCLCLIGAFCCLFLPETTNKQIPVTLEDGENFGKDEKFFDFLFPKKPEAESTSTLS